MIDCNKKTWGWLCMFHGSIDGWTIIQSTLNFARGLFNFQKGNFTKAIFRCVLEYKIIAESEFSLQNFQHYFFYVVTNVHRIR